MKATIVHLGSPSRLRASAVPGSVRTLTFGGSQAVTLVAGGDALSDPVNLRVAPLSDVLVSVFLPGPTGPLTNHPFTAQGNFLGSGDLASSVSGSGYGSTPCWMVVSGVDVRAVPRVTDPANPTAMRPAFDSGDHLHPNDAGCQAMAAAVSLSMLLGER